MQGFKGALLQKSPFSRQIQAADPRLKLLLTAGLGLLVWNGGLAGMICIGLLVLVVLAVLALGDRLRMQGLVAGGLFALFWTLVAWGLGLWEGRAPFAAFEQAALLGGRLLLLLFLGVALALGSSARQLGLGVCWLLRPFLGRRSWQVALGMSLMVQFLPRTLETLAQVRRMERLRAPERGLWQRWGLMAETVLRVLSQNVWKQTMALAARGLDAAQAWEPEFSQHPFVWLVGCAVLALCTGVSLL